MVWNSWMKIWKKTLKSAPVNTIGIFSFVELDVGNKVRECISSFEVSTCPIVSKRNFKGCWNKIIEFYMPKCCTWGYGE